MPAAIQYHLYQAMLPCVLLTAVCPTLSKASANGIVPEAQANGDPPSKEEEEASDCKLATVISENYTAIDMANCQIRPGISVLFLVLTGLMISETWLAAFAA